MERGITADLDKLKDKIHDRLMMYNATKLYLGGDGRFYTLNGSLNSPYDVLIRLDEMEKLLIDTYTEILRTKDV
jgi:hypothetical protein